MFFKLLLIILFLSILRCNSDLVNNDNGTLSLISNGGDTQGKPEPLPNKEALSFLRPTIVRGPPSMLSRHDQIGSYSDIDRVDTEHSPRYINPIPINREFGAVPFGYRTTPLRKSAGGPPNSGTNRSRTKKISAAHPSFDPHDRAFHGDESPYKTSYHSPMGTEYSYGNEEATLEGSGLFKYISPDEFGSQFDLYESDFDFDSDSGSNYVRRMDEESLFDSREKQEGSLQSALTSLWRYKKLAYQTLLARSGSIGKEMMRNSDDQNSWSKVWKDPGDQNTRANSRFRQKYPNNMPFGGNLGKRTNTESQKSSTTRFRNPTLIPRKRTPSFAVNPNKRNTDSLYSRYPSDTITKRHEIPDGYHLVPRYKDAGHSVRSPHAPTTSGDQRRAASNYEGNSVTRRGRTPRMQLVKQIKRVSIDDSNDDFSNRNDDEKDKENDDENDSKNDVENDKTFKKDDIVVLNVTLIDRRAEEEEEKGNEYYAYYVDVDVDVENDSTSSASNRMDVGTDFYYYDQNYETVDVKTDEGTDGGGIVTFEYIDDEEYDDDDSVDEYAVDDGDDPVDGIEYVYSSTGNVDVEDTEDDSTLSKRQGFFDFPLFGGKKKNEKKKTKPSRRPYPRAYPSEVSPPEGNRRPYSHPSSDSSFSSSDGEPSSPHTKEFSRGNKTKNIRVRIKSSPNIKKKKKIRMKIMEIKDPSGSKPVVVFPFKDVNHNVREGPIIYHSSPAQNDGSFGPPKDVISGGFINQGQRFPSNQNRKKQKGTKTKNYSTTFKKIHLNSGLGGAMSTKMNVGHDNEKVMSLGGTKNAIFGGLKSGLGGMKGLGFSGTKNKGYGRPTPATYGGMQAGYGRPANMGYEGFKNPTVKDSVGWSALTQMSDNLPDLNKAITIMSFVAFSVFVANLGVNALANSSLGIQFGRGDPNFFSMNPDFNLEKMIKNLDALLEEEQKLNGTRGMTFQKVADFVTAVYNDLHETTRLEMENAKDKIKSFLERNFSDDDLPVGDISKGFLTKRLEFGQPFGELEDTCYRRLLCLAHNLTMEYKKEDKRNQLLPFWTFGIGWLKGGESNVVNLLENLRAELAGQNGRDCHKLFSDCENKKRVEELAKDVKMELEEELDRKEALKLTEEDTQNLETIIITTTSRSTI